MVRTEQRATIRQFVCFAVAKQDSAFRFQLPASLQVVQVSVEGNLAQDYYHFHIRKRGELTIEKCSAISNLFRRRFILRRSAAYSSRNVSINKLKSILASYSRRLGGKSRF